MLYKFPGVGFAVSESPGISCSYIARNMAFKIHMQPVGHMGEPAVAGGRGRRTYSHVMTFGAAALRAGGCNGKANMVDPVKGIGM
jgi:hypothetical protein